MFFYLQVVSSLQEVITDPYLRTETLSIFSYCFSLSFFLGTNIIPNIVFMIGVLVAMVSQGHYTEWETRWSKKKEVTTKSVKWMLRPTYWFYELNSICCRTLSHSHSCIDIDIKEARKETCSFKKTWKSSIIQFSHDNLHVRTIDLQRVWFKFDILIPIHLLLDSHQPSILETKRPSTHSWMSVLIFGMMKNFSTLIQLSTTNTLLSSLQHFVLYWKLQYSIVVLISKMR